MNPKLRRIGRILEFLIIIILFIIGFRIIMFISVASIITLIMASVEYLEPPTIEKVGLAIQIFGWQVVIFVVLGIMYFVFKNHIKIKDEKEKEKRIQQIQKDIEKLKKKVKI